MADRLPVSLAFFPLPDSLCLGWVVCLAIFGLAYYTNPSEKSFKRFLDQLPISAQQNSLRRFGSNLNLPHPAPPPRTKNKTQQNTSKQSTGQRNPKNLSRSSAPPKLSFSFRTSHHNRHNLLLCTLISVDHPHHSFYNIPPDQAAEDGYPQLEWFLGCFDTWFSLQAHRQTSTTMHSFSIDSCLESLKLFCNRWALNIPGTFLFPPPPTDELFSSLQNVSLLSKGRRKKSHRSQKLATLRCQTSVHSDHFAECSPSEDCSTPTSSGSERDCYTTQVSTPPSLCASPTTRPSVNLSSGTIGINARAPGHITPPDEMLVSLTLNTRLNPKLSGTITSSESKSSSKYPPNDTSRPLFYDTKKDLAQGLKREPPKPSPECCQQGAEQDLKPSSHDLENQLKESDFKRHQEDLNKIHYQASLKHLNEIKDLKEFKHRNLDEKLSQSRSAHTKLSKQSAKVQEDLEAIRSKCASIQSKFARDTQQIKKEGERLKTAIKHSKAEIDQLAKATGARTAKKKELKEKLASCLVQLDQKRELNKRSKPDGQLVRSSSAERHSVTQDSETQKSVPMRPNPSQSSTPSSMPPHEIENLATKSNNGCAATTYSGLTWPQPQNSLAPHQVENSAVPMLFHSFTHNSYPPDDAWAPDPWSETIHQNNIRETFISLPNLERSALKDYYPALQALNTFLPHPPFPVSPLAEEVFNYRQEVNLPCSAGITSDWARPVSSQPFSPFGAIGQHGSPTRGPARSSPVVNPSPFRFPASSAAVAPSNCSGLMAGAGCNRQENFSRTSSSSSLSQTPGYCSIRSSPVAHYAPIGTLVHSNNKRLNEPQESFGGFKDRSRQGSTVLEADFTHSRVPSISSSSRSLQSTIAPNVGISARETTEGIFPTGTIVEEGPLGLRKQPSTQCLGSILPPEGCALNSIFDVAPETGLPSTTPPQRPLAPSPPLNPSAKAFTFSPAARPCSVTRPCPTSSIGQQRARGYSHSTIPSSGPGTTRLSGLDTKAESPEQAKLRKSLHRSSWSVVVGLKATAAGSSADHPSRTRETSSSRFKQQADQSRSAGGRATMEKSGTFCSHESTDSLDSKVMDVPKLTGSPSELASVLSPGHALPAEFTKAACAGLFGPIGDSKHKKSFSALSAPANPPLPIGLSDPSSRQPFATHRAGWDGSQILSSLSKVNML